MAGFPTYEQYLRIEEEYLTSLSDRKQPKALISQALFDKILAVLQNGSEDRASTAQFRFWVRKMFVLVYPQTSFYTSRHNAGGGVPQSSSAPEPVVLHDKRPVAIKEQLYEVLCYCHAMARHGGRDKTCATLRLHYSWVPKELTAKFVKTCPTCTLKRSGNPDLLSHFGQAVQSHSQPQLLPYAPQILPSPLPAVESALLFPGGPNDSPPSLSFVVGVGSAGFDEANTGGGGGGCGTGFGPSIFATPDLSVYPSPTLSTGSLGPMTPSPYLPGGLFGYPAVFDPGHGYGHGSLSSVSGWDPSPLSPCVPMMYAEELRAGTPMLVQPVSVDEIIDMRARGMQLHLPTPKAVRAMRTRVQSCGGGGDGDGDGRGVDTFSGVMDTPCPVDMSNIDPVLLVGGGYPSLTLVGPPHARTMADAITGPEVDADADADADMDSCAGNDGEPPYFHNRASTWETPTPVVGAGYPISMQGLTVTPGRPLPPPLDDVDVDVDEAHRKRKRMPFRLPVEDARWDNPEAWLVHSDSVDDPRSI